MSSTHTHSTKVSASIPLDSSSTQSLNYPKTISQKHPPKTPLKRKNVKWTSSTQLDPTNTNNRSSSHSSYPRHPPCNISSHTKNNKPPWKTKPISRIQTTMPRTNNPRKKSSVTQSRITPPSLTLWSTWPSNRNRRSKNNAKSRNWNHRNLTVKKSGRNVQ